MKNLDAYYKKVADDFGTQTADAAKELFSLYTDGIYKWLAGLWDGEVGGFYYSNSARDNEGFFPDIESTSQAFGSLMTDGIVSSMQAYPEAMKKKAVAFITGCQDKDDGYFYHKQWKEMMLADPMRYTSRRARDMNKGMSIVKAFGGEAKYPIATERISAATKGEAQNVSVMIPEHLKNKEVFVEYLESLEINKNSYSVGHRLGAQVSQIRAAGLDGILYDFLNSTQKSNGLWEDELNYGSSNGLMKISCAYRSLRRPIPNIEKGFDAAIEIALSAADMYQGITCVYNPPFTMLNLFETMKDLGMNNEHDASKRRLREKAAELLIRTKEKVATFSEPDGSFSYCVGYPAPHSQGMKVCVPHLPESDVNANALAQGARTMMLKAIGLDSTPIFDENDSKIFFEICGEK